MPTKLQRVNALRRKCRLDPLEKLPKVIGQRCEHCVSKVSHDELDTEYCNTCGSRINVRLSDEDWNQMRGGT